MSFISLLYESCIGFTLFGSQLVPLTAGQKPRWVTVFLLVVSPHNQSRNMFSSARVGFLLWFLWLKKSQNHACLNICFYKWTSLWSDFPTKLTLVTETINRWLTTASNPLRIHVLRQKYLSHLSEAEEDRKLEKQLAKKRWNCTEKRADLSENRGQVCTNLLIWSLMQHRKIVVVERGVETDPIVRCRATGNSRGR